MGNPQAGNFRTIHKGQSGEYASIVILCVHFLTFLIRMLSYVYSASFVSCVFNHIVTTLVDRIATNDLDIIVAFDTIASFHILLIACRLHCL